ncbi:GlxA family transcriptional regulator [Antrihabitans cavernicola]|uniref:Helix-turn-helix domain-containing protein n=1 Tax=Antrihabitans cavernicola TaxID=2495913 RepID=A0A5A7SJB8_9NOCA|nr:helix-turn-helix domain-containing protein [Spelaeibacter cavernicola]KAA0024847.1 helix-turn-helix domain-containing protein [Spelaeibacter cavernicola]
MKRHQVVVLLIEPIVGFDASIPPLIFGTALGPDGDELYDVTLCGLSTDPVATTTGYAIVPMAGPEALETADTVIVPGTKSARTRTDGSLPDDVAAALSRIRPGTRMVSICTGAFVLAAAGLLDDRPATTHWRYAAEFRTLFPKVRLDEEVLFVDDGDVLSSAGLAAGIDLCLHIIRRDHGAAVANDAAKYCVVPPWREGGQAQFIQRPVPQAANDSTARAREWALENLHDAINVEQLSRISNMSVRTFNRRFTEQTGRSPGAWVLEQRIERARHLLESGDLPIDEVARQAGLGTGASLRQHIRRSVGMSPLRYRKTFQGV